jgi:hypothetical protein
MTGASEWLGASALSIPPSDASGAFEDASKSGEGMASSAGVDASEPESAKGEASTVLILSSAA